MHIVYSIQCSSGCKADIEHSSVERQTKSACSSCRAGGKDGDEDEYTIQIHIQHKDNMNTTQIQFYYNANQDTLVKGSMCLRS